MLIVCNIGHESAIEAGDPLHYTPPRIIRQMRSALWCLPLWAVPRWVKEPWWVHPFSNSLSPYLTDRELSHVARDDVRDSELIVWGHERSLAHTLTKHYGLSSGSACYELASELEPSWTRAASVRFFESYSSIAWREQVTMISSVEELRERMTLSSVILKLPYSSSGRGLWRISRLDCPLEETLRKLLRRHQNLLVEPLLDKVQDYGAEYYIARDGSVECLGLCAFETDAAGHYLESICQDPTQTHQQLADSLANPSELAQALAQHHDYLVREIAPYYHGAVGIDLLTYRTSEGQLALHPWVEINLRYTMGHYALDLYRERVPRDTTGDYRIGILSAQRVRPLLDSSTPPLLDTGGRLLSGLLPLTATDLTAVSHVAYLRHSEEWSI